MTRVLNAVSSPSFSAAQYLSPLPEMLTLFGAPLSYKRGRGDDIFQSPKKRLRNRIFIKSLRECAGKLKYASPAGLLSGPAFLEGRLGKAEPSMVASAVPRSCLSLQSLNIAFARFFAHQWRNTLNAHVYFANSGLLGNLLSPHPLVLTISALLVCTAFLPERGEEDAATLRKSCRVDCP